MTLPTFALKYNKYSKQELRGFVKRRLGLSGREFRKSLKHRKSSRHDLIERLQKLDQTATFRFLDLPPELRESIYEFALLQPESSRLLLPVSRQILNEVEQLFWQRTTFDMCDRTPRLQEKAF